ncbi:MAG: hypothetical protein H6737_11955 [Alphaproteobacteria bacterium]|nr:hypothetical protein [Alphaproteobacteria bacterium]
MIALALMLGCHHHEKLVATWPGPDGRSCDDQRVIALDPDPWTTVSSVAVRLDARSPAAVARAREPVAVVHPADLAAGFLLDLDGELGPASCSVVPTHPDAEQRECGGYGFTLHYQPLCEHPAMEEGLERKARPEVANFVLAQKFGSKMPEDDVRDAWNALEPFGLAARIAACETTPEAGCETLLAVRDQMDRGLARLDALDRFDDPKDARDLEAIGAGLDWCQWTPTPDGLRCIDPHPLRELLLDDYLVVDTTRRCGIDTQSFLEIELAHLQERPPGPDGARHQTCGGRTLADDVVDRLLTLTINGPHRVPPGAPLYGPTDAEADPQRGDGVDGPPEPFDAVFPWLRPPRRPK